MKHPRRKGALSLLCTTLLSALLLLNSVQPQAVAEQKKSLFIKNPRFATRKSDSQPVRDWLWLERNPGATAFAPLEGEGALLMAASELARGDLLSSSLKIKPFSVIEVSLEYKVELGNPLLFICVTASMLTLLSCHVERSDRLSGAR